MTFHLIGIAGIANSGKDTLASMLMECEAYRKVAFADPLKDMLCVMLDISRELLEDREYKEATNPDLLTTPRFMMQSLGTEWGRKWIHKDLWIILARKRIEKYLQYRHVVVTDIRFENEAALIRELGGQIVHLLRPSAGINSAHVSEQRIATHPGDYYLNNAGTLHTLRGQAITLHEYMLRRQDERAESFKAP
jgi:hypothetical protein